MGKITEAARELRETMNNSVDVIHKAITGGATTVLLGRNNLSQLEAGQAETINHILAKKTRNIFGKEYNDKIQSIIEEEIPDSLTLSGTLDDKYQKTNDIFQKIQNRIANTASTTATTGNNEKAIESAFHDTLSELGFNAKTNTFDDLTEDQLKSLQKQYKDVDFTPFGAKEKPKITETSTGPTAIDTNIYDDKENLGTGFGVSAKRHAVNRYQQELEDLNKRIDQYNTDQTGFKSDDAYQKGLKEQEFYLAQLQNQRKVSPSIRDYIAGNPKTMLGLGVPITGGTVLMLARSNGSMTNKQLYGQEPLE
jgi:hypothetical protein